MTHEELNRKAAEFMGWKPRNGDGFTIWYNEGYAVYFTTEEDEDGLMKFNDDILECWNPAADRNQLWMALGKLDEEQRDAVYDAIISNKNPLDGPPGFWVFQWFIDTPCEEVLRVVLDSCGILQNRL